MYLVYIQKGISQNVELREFNLYSNLLEQLSIWNNFYVILAGPRLLIKARLNTPILKRVNGFQHCVGTINYLVYTQSKSRCSALG